MLISLSCSSLFIGLRLIAHLKYENIKGFLFQIDEEKEKKDRSLGNNLWSNGPRMKDK